MRSDPARSQGTRPRRRRPVLVWVVFLWYLVTSGYTLVSFWMIYSGFLPVSPEVAAYLSTQSALDHAGTVVLLLLNLAGAVALVMLRKVAFPLCATALTLSLLLTIKGALSKGFVAALGGAGAVGLVVGCGIGIAVCIYAWRLRTGRVLA